MTILGALIIACGALVGIWLGARYASERIVTQLEVQNRWEAERREDDAARLQQQLDAEAERLERQLDHDRRLRDREELRAVVDELAGSIAQCVDLTIDAKQALDKAVGYDGEDETEALENKKARLEALLKAREKSYEMTFERPRLWLRFGRGHSVCVAYYAVQKGLREWNTHLRVDDPDEWDADAEAKYDELVAQSSEQNRAFIEACRPYTDVELIQPPASNPSGDAQ